MLKKLWAVLALIGIIVATPILRARADGLLIIEGVYRQPAVSHINVVIENKIATTTLEQTFRNDLEKQVEAVYVAPVPPGATLTSFAQWLNGDWVEAEVKDSDQAKKEFEAAADQGKDAALASGSVNAGVDIDPRMTFQTRLVLPPLAERKIRLIYTEVLTGDVGLTRYTYPLSQTNLTNEPVGDLLVNIKIVEKDEIRAVYSPSHNSKVEVGRADKTSAEAVYRAQNVVPDQDFELVYTQSADRFGLNLASYRDPKDPKADGYFVLIAAPQLEVKESEVVQKDFVFILDRSGSMNGPKFEQAKAALLNILDKLNEGDRFAITVFDDGVTRYETGLLTLDKRSAARAWVTLMQIGGGTNINDALLNGLGTVDESSQRPHIVVFLTDGQATAGVVETPAILNNIRKAIRPQSRLYTIGIGDVNQPLLESLAQENRGSAMFVDAYGDIQKPLSSFYAALNYPVLVDLQLDFGGVEVYDLHPDPIPDMFLGGQVVLTGRYKGGGPTTVTLAGMINGEKHVSKYENIQFITDSDLAVVNKAATSNSYVPRLWAQRKVETLVRQLAINGNDPKLIEEVKSLGMQYKIVTPYTSFVVADPSGDNNKPVAGLPQTGLPLLYMEDYRPYMFMGIGLLMLLLSMGGVGINLLISRLRRR